MKNDYITEMVVSDLGKRAAIRNRKRARRRKVLPGFPVDPRPFTLADIRAYFSGDSIQCLLCGRHLKRLATHLPLIHGVHEDIYREMFGLPWRRGLTSNTSHERYSEAMKLKIAEGYILPGTDETRALAKAKIGKQRFQPFRAEVSAENLVSFNAARKK